MTHPARSRTVRRATSKVVKLRIALDCHDTVMDNQEAIRKLVRQKETEKGRKLTEKEMEELRDYAFQNIEFVRNEVHPVPRAIEYIQLWKKYGHDISFISRSDFSAHAATCIWLVDHSLSKIASKLHNTSSEVVSKAEVILPGEYDAIVENKSPQALSLCQVVRYVFLLDRNSSDRSVLHPYRARLAASGSPIVVSGYRAINQYIQLLTRHRLTDDEDEELIA
jgi:hypothetical protein